MPMMRIDCETMACVAPDDASKSEHTNCIKCGRLMMYVGRGFVRRPEEARAAKPRSSSGSDFVWVDVNGIRVCAVWHTQDDGTVVGGARHVPIARHRLAIDEEDMPLDQLAKRYLAPAVVKE